MFRDLAAMGHRMEDEASTSEHEEMPPLAIQDGEVASDGETTLHLGACSQQDTDNEDSLEGLLEVHNTHKKLRRLRWQNQQERWMQKRKQGSR